MFFDSCRFSAWPWTLAALAAGALCLDACDTPRERPTGLTAPVPATTIIVMAPRQQQLVPLDSTAFVVVQAQGLLQAVEVALTVNSFPDTLGFERQAFETPQESVELIFSFLIPGRLLSGTQVRVQGVAVDLAGRRHLSDPVVVVAIDCDEFIIACADL